MFIRMYTTPTASTPSTIASGTLRRGFLISPDTHVTYTHPSYAKNTAISATPIADASCPDDKPAPSPIPCELKFDQLPLPMANPSTTNAVMARHFVQVERLLSSAPQRRPITLIPVRMAISASAKKWARVKLIPSTEKMMCSCPTAGKILPAYVAEATARAAMLPPLATANNIQP